MKHLFAPEDKIIIEYHEVKEETTAGGIFLSKSAAASVMGPQKEGMVVAVGSKCEGVEISDKVVFKAYAPEEIEIKEDGDVRKFLVISPLDLLAILR